MKVILVGGIVLMVATTSGPQKFRVTADAVLVDVLVTDGKMTVAGLRSTDFELRDSGVLQRLESISFEDVPLSMMLALDASSSVDGQSLEHLKQAGSAAAGLLRPGDRGALLTFSEQIDLASGWTADHQELARAIARTKASGGTALHDAAYAALTLNDPEVGRPLIIVFSDGDDTASWLSGRAVVDVARRSDAVIYAVGVRGAAARRHGYLMDFRSGVQADIPREVPSELTRSFLSALAQETGGQYLEAERSERLRETFERIVTEFRTRYLLTYIPTGVDKGGWHPIEVKLKSIRGKVTARRGYLR
jgi:VWFA-related protein